MLIECIIDYVDGRIVLRVHATSRGAAAGLALALAALLLAGA